MRTTDNRCSQHGFTLVEVMVALVIFSISLLGLAGLQAAALRDNQIANQNSIATQLAGDMAERLRTNPLGVENGDYNSVTARPGMQECYSGSCTVSEIALMDQYQWFTELQEMLPSGTGSISGDGTRFTITVMWDQDRTGATGTGCGTDRTTDLKCLSVTVEP